MALTATKLKSMMALTATKLESNMALTATIKVLKVLLGVERKHV